MRDDDTQPVGDRPSPDEVRQEARRRILDLIAERRRREDELRATLDEWPRALRQAHDAGLPWEEIAELAGYRSATVARNQAAPRGDSVEASDGSVTVREAAQRLGVTPQAVYAMIESGRIRVADKRQRGTRVHLPPRDGSL